MTSEEAYNYLLGLLESGGDMRWSLVKESMDKFKELVEQQSNPSFSECIKEWEEKGFKSSIYQGILRLQSQKRKCSITIWLDLKIYECTRYRKPFYYTMDMELHNLLTKTLKALEAENDK